VQGEQIKIVENIEDSKILTSDKKLSKEDVPKEKPWVVYLRTLRIPIICPIHRKLFLLISEEFKNPEPKDVKKKTNFSSITSIKRVANRNPNCNHNNSAYYNSRGVNIKTDKDAPNEEKLIGDLLWKNGDAYQDNTDYQSKVRMVYFNLLGDGSCN
jgi:hypothetical protein